MNGYKAKALSILHPIKQIDDNTQAKNDFLFTAKKSNASKNLPDYYLIYLLFSKLLEFKNLGRFEKIAWSFPIDYNGKAFLIEYRKFGVGVFVQDKDDENDAAEIAKKISGAVKCARPFFDKIANDAIHSTSLNIINHNELLYERCVFLKTQYDNLTVKLSEDIDSMIDYRKLQFQIIGVAISYIEAFFSWTEHLFIHLSVISGAVISGDALSEIIKNEWKYKYTKAIPKNQTSDKFLASLLTIRTQLRNFFAHGSFGKENQSLEFHTGTGAIPVYMSYRRSHNNLSLNNPSSYKYNEAIAIIDEFIYYLWNCEITPAMYYTQQHYLPTIMTYAVDGQYKKAMANLDEMNILSMQIIQEIENGYNMDW